MAPWFVLVVAACGPGPSGLPPDQSTAISGDTAGGDAPRQGGAMIPATDEIREASATGPIETITPEPLSAGIFALRVVIAGETPEAERSFRLVLPDGVPVPFAVGDVVSLTIETLPGPPTWQPMNITVRAPDGALLAMYGVVAPDDWTVDSGGEAETVDQGDYDEIERYVSITHGGRTAITDRGRFRRIEASDGVWFVSGSASDLDGEVPADGGSTLSVMIVRGR
jgi:hypothetical protein